jgi:hypothetical protein
MQINRSEFVSNVDKDEDIAVLDIAQIVASTLASTPEASKHEA